MELETEKDEIKIQDFKTRLATLTDGITTLKVGGQTEQERREYKHRVEDAVRALQSARSEGIVPGEGIALLRCVNAVEAIRASNRAQEFGISLVKRALSTPMRRIFEVAGLENPDYMVGQIGEFEGAMGYDFEKC